MRNYIIRSLRSVVALLAFSPAFVLAQATPQSGAAKAPPDLSGVWDLGGAAGYAPDIAEATIAKELATGRVPVFGFISGEPPMQPWAAERYKANREGMKPPDRGKETADPIMYPYCLPQGMPRVYTVPFSFEIVQTPSQVYMLFEANHLVRRIYTDGRKHLEGWVASFMGTSIGKWDGDTLVVETDNIIGLDGGAWIDTFGHPQSDAMRVTERVRRVDRNTLQIDFLFDDPKAYTKPWAGRKVFRLKPDWDVTEQILCENHQREEFVQDMAQGKPKGKP